MNLSLDNKVALVTGASRGIGQLIAETLAANGARVVVNYVSNQSLADETVKNIEQKGGQAVAIQADVSKISELQSLFQKTLDQFGKIDILVNTAGLMDNKPLEQVSEDDFDRAFAINVKGTYFACQLAAQHMPSGGRIINFSTSVVGFMIPAYSVYAATKGAVEQLTRHLCKELAPKGITINAIAPGPVNTELFTRGKTEAQIKTFASMAAFGRLGEPEDIARVVLLLVSEEAGWITGQTLRANGGYV